jgi:hypothetical protein
VKYLLAATARFFALGKKEEKSSSVAPFGLDNILSFLLPNSHSLKQRKHKVKITHVTL